MKNRIVALIIASLISATAFTQGVPQLGKAPVKSVVAAMTLEEKATLVVGAGMRFPGMPAQEEQGPVVGHTEDLVAGAAGTTYGLPRLGIPQMVVADGPAGLRITPVRKGDETNTYYCTAFPVGTLLASTWDVDLAKSVGQAMGNETKEYGVDVLLGPALNIHRNPLCGRNFEYLSEDPLISGEIAAAIVNGVESQGVGTSIKHFVANNAETNRNTLNTVVSERALREIYLKGFEIAVKKAQPWTVMSSYNLINGVYASESNDLLTKVLRNDWGFQGFVMTDWFGGKDPVAQMTAGNDLLMPGSPKQIQAIIDAVKEEKLDEKVLDMNVTRILNIILQSPRYNGYSYSDKPDLKSHAAVTRQAATEGMVLLKNDNATLPFPQEVKRIAAFGNTSYEIITGGTGSGDVNEAYSVALVEGLQNVGYAVNENLMTMYEAYLKAAREGKEKSRVFMMASRPIPELVINKDLAASMVNVSDAAMIVIGRNAGEGRDRTPEEGDFLLTPEEKSLIKNVTDVYHEKGKKVVVILNIGGVIETAGWKDMPDAILLAWQGGQETGNSIADVVSGRVNPSGKLASTFPVNYSDVPSAGNFPGKPVEQVKKDEKKDAGEEDIMASFFRPVPSLVTYEEGIYVGYRYYNTFDVPVSYEFGYGMSYTSFGYTDLRLSSSRFAKKITATVTIKNTGSVAGKEVVELYLAAPGKKLDKPSSELKGFAKTKLLQPGESQVVTFELNAGSLASFDPAISAWVAESGTYKCLVGASSRDIKLNATFTVAKDITVKRESVALVPAVKIYELKKQ